MKLRILKEKNNPLVGRVEIFFEIEGEATTPSRREVLALLAAEKGAAPEAIALVKLSQRFGCQRVHGRAHLYPDKAALQRFEPAHLLARSQTKEEKGGGKEGDAQASSEGGGSASAKAKEEEKAGGQKESAAGR